VGITNPLANLADYARICGARAATGRRLFGGELGFGGFGGFGLGGSGGLVGLERRAHAIGTIGAVGHRLPGGFGAQASLADVLKAGGVRVRTGFGGALQIEIAVFHSNTVPKARSSGRRRTRRP